jgi:hypothetical protein
MRAICGATAALYDDLRKKFWAEVATGNGRDFVEAKLAERKMRHSRQGESRYLVEPNVKEGKGGLRDLQTLYWIGKYLYHVDDSADLVEHGVFTREEYRIFQKAEAFLWNVRVPSALPDEPAGGATVVRRAALAGGGAGLYRSGKAGPRRWKASCAPTSWWPRMSAT